jgi:two-component system nitrogen regulation response regulator GlnG
MLTRHFLQQSAQQLGVEPKRISDAALSRLSTFAFPGNMRQLENICHWLTVMAPAQLIEPKDLPPEVMAGSTAEAPASSPRALATLPEAAAGGAVGDVPHEIAFAPAGAGSGVAAPVAGTWESALEAEAHALLASGHTDVWEALTRRFESRLILTALQNTRGRRIEAAHKLGIGRNTITRKIQELGLE